MSAASPAHASHRPGLVVALLAATVIALPFLTSAVPGGLGVLPNRWVTVGILGATYAMLALGLVVVTGWCGVFVLGYSGFFAIGAYTYGLLNSAAFGLHLGAVLGVPLAALVSVGVALVLGLATVRVRGDHFALITLAFGEMVRIALTNLRDLTGGSAGLLGIDPLMPWPGGDGLAITSSGARYVLGWLGVGMLGVWLSRVRRTPLGRAWVAVREDEEAARSVGVATVRVKLIALAVAAAVAAVAGCFFAASQLSLLPSTFSMLSSFIPVTALVIGGMGAVQGSVLGTLLLLAIPEVVRDLGGGGAKLLDYQMLIYGGAMLAVILLRPGGLTEEPVYGLRGQPDRSPEPGPSPGASLRLNGLTARYEGVVAIAGLALTIRSGELIGVIGPNGSGKTTLLNVISGFHPAAGGATYLDGVAIDAWPPDRRVGGGVARTFQMNRLFTGVSNAENVGIAADTALARPGLRDLCGGRGRDAGAQSLAAACLGQFPDRFPPVRWVQRPSTLSFANRRRLEIARALGTRPRLLLLDEPTAGMNPVDRQELLGQVRRWADAGMTVVVVEHQLGALAEVADRLVALDHGVVIADGSPAAVLADAQVVKALMKMEPGGEPAPR